MTTSRTALVLLAVLGLLALPGAASAKPRPWHVHGGATTLKLDPGTAQALTDLGLTVSPLEPATAGSKGIAFPITGGRLDRKTYAGRIRHSGGLRLAAGATKVDLRNFTIRIDKHPNLTARVGGSRLSIADLDLSEATIKRHGHRLRIAGVIARLTDTAAAALDQAFGTDALEGGLVLGTATVHTRLAR